MQTTIACNRTTARDLRNANYDRVNLTFATSVEDLRNAINEDEKSAQERIAAEVSLIFLLQFLY